MAASAGAVRAGRAFIEIFADDSRLVRGLRRAQQRMQAFGQSVQQIGLRMFALGGAMAAPFALAVKAASDAEQTMQRFRAVFKDQADAADAFAVSFAEAMGRSKTNVRQTMTTFQAMFVGLGFGSEQATQMSISLQKLATDFGAFFDKSDSEVMERFIAALAGSPQVLDQFGIDIRQATIEAELLAMGINKSVHEATEQEKVMARIRIIMRGAAAAEGAAAREAGTFQGQMRKLEAAWIDFKVAVGNALLPVLTPVVAKFQEIVGALKRIAEENPGIVKSIALLAVGLMGVGAALIAIGTGGLLLSGILSAIATAFAFLANPITIVAGSLIALLGVFTQVSGGFEVLKQTAIASFQGIADALMSGNIALAGKIMWLALKMEWIRGVNFLEGLWSQFAGFFEDTFAFASANLAKFFVSAVESMKMAWLGFVRFYINTFLDALGMLPESVREKMFGINDLALQGLGIGANAIINAAQGQVGEEGAAQRAEIDAMTEADQRAREAQREMQRARGQEEFEEARREWIEAMEEAARLRRESDKKLAGPEVGGGGIPSIAAALGAAQDRASVAGTFSAAAVRGLGSATVFDKIAKATEDTAKNTDDLVNGAGGLAFT